MEESWDWVDEQRRRQRQRRRFYIFGLLISLPAFLTMYSMVNPSSSSRIRPATQHNRQATPRPHVENKESPPESDALGALGRSPAELITPPEKSEALVDQHVAQSRREPFDAARPAARRALTRLEDTLDRLDAQRCNQFAPDLWREINSLKVAAAELANPDDAMTAVERALQLLESLPALLDTREVLAEANSQPISVTLANLISVRQRFADQPFPSEAEEWLRSVTRGDWLNLADHQLSRATSDDPGLAEAWLSIAEVWHLAGNDSETRESIRRGRESLARMVDAERMIESAIKHCGHDAFNSTFADDVIRRAAVACEDVADTGTRGGFYADLAGLAFKFGEDTIATELLEKAIGPTGVEPEFGVTEKMILLRRCRTASWTEPAASVLKYCEQIERRPYPSPMINSAAYSYAAMAAARRDDRTGFVCAMLRAETAIAPRGICDYPNYLAAVRLAEANIQHRRWKAAVVIANNIPDPYRRGSLLLRVMKDSPQDVRTRNPDELFRRFSNLSGATSGISGYTEHQIRTGKPLLDVVFWIDHLPHASQRAAAFAGFAKTHPGVSQTQLLRHRTAAADQPNPNFADPDALMRFAEQTASEVTDPVVAAFAWLEIARTWHRLDKPTKYRDSITNIHASLMDAWHHVWLVRPPVRRSVNGGFVYADDRHRPSERDVVQNIAICQRELAGLQVQAADFEGALETVLDLANVSGFLADTQASSDFNFLYLQALLTRMQSETGVSPDVLIRHDALPGPYPRALVAAWTDNIAGMQQEIEHLTLPSQRGQLARACGELAILHAKRGNHADYLRARRRAFALIGENRVPNEIKLVLAVADAHAGDFALAERNLVNGSLPWFGDASVPRSLLAVKLAQSNRWPQAMVHTEKVSHNYPVLRSAAWSAIAQARYEPTPSKQLIDWASSLAKSSDRVAVWCGFALAADEFDQASNSSNITE